MTYDDLTIQKYFAGTLDVDTAHDLEQAILNDPELEARLLALDPARDTVKQAFDHLTVPQFDVAPPAAQKRPWLGVAAAAVVLVGGMGILLQSDPIDDWHVQVAQYQALYTPQTIAMIDVDSTDLTEQFTVMTRSLGGDFTADRLRDVTGLTLLRGQLLGFEDQPLGQIVFASATGQPIALCVMQTDEDSTPNVTARKLSGLESVSWTQDGFEYLMIGNATRDDLKTWVDEIQRKI